MIDENNQARRLIMIHYLKKYVFHIGIFFVITNVYSYQGFLHKETISPRILVGDGLKKRFNTESYTIFNRAIINNKFDVIQKMLEMNVVNISMVIDAVIREHNLVMLESLLQKGYIKGDCKLTYNGKKVSLVDFVLSKNTFLANLPDSMVVSMVKNGASINKLVGDERVTPLFKALEAKNVPLFDTLLTHGADPALKNKDGSSVLTHLKNNTGNNDAFCAALTAHGFDANKNDLTRGRTFTAPRKKIQHSWGKSMMAQSFN